MKKVLVIFFILFICLLILLVLFSFYFLPGLKKEKTDNQENISPNITQEVSILPQQTDIEQKAQEEAKKPDPYQSVFVEGVPFISQATGAQWKDPRFQDACEETSAFIAVSWAQGKTEISRQENTDLVIALAAFQLKSWGSYHDTSVADTAERIFKKYFHFDDVAIKPIQNIQDILENLHEQKIVIVPINGQAVGNPYYTSPGPERHMIIIVGYDAKTREIITNDIGIGKGLAYRYGEKVLFDAIRDYNTGYHEPFPAPTRKLMLVISKKEI